MQGRLENAIKTERNIEFRLSELPFYVREWYLELKASDNTPTTCLDYIRKIANFLFSIDALNSDTISTDRITENAVKEFIIECKTKIDKNGIQTRTSDSYQEGIWYALNNFLEFMKNHNYIEQNYMHNIKKVKNRDLERIKENRIKLDISDFKKILDYVEKDMTFEPMKQRDAAILRLFMTTGMRKTALEEINVDDYDIENNRLAVIDKGDKYQFYNINRRTAYVLEQWIKEREYIASAGEDALFISKDGTRLSKRAVYVIVQKYSEKVLGIKLSPHKLRAGFCSIMYEKTKDIETVRRMVGHSNLSTTQRYIVTDNNERKQAADLMEEMLD